MISAMMSVQGYFDGVAFRPLEKIAAKPNQRVIITVMDEFVEPQDKKRAIKMRGILSQYADPALAEKEKGAWERAMVKKHSHA